MARMDYRLGYRLPWKEAEYPLCFDLLACRRLVFGVFDDADSLGHVAPADSDEIRSLPQGLPEETSQWLEERIPAQSIQVCGT